MEKTYVFDTNSGGNFDHTALIASLMGNRGVDPNLMAMLNNCSKNQDAWGGGGMWWIWVIIMFWLWGGNGNGMFGRNGYADGIPNQLNNDYGREVLLQAINGNGSAISQLATTLNCDVNALQTAINQAQSSIQAVGNQVGMSAQQIINAVQSGNCQLGNQIAQCCCSVTDAITRSNYENQISNLNQTNQLQSSINFVNSSVERGITSNAYEMQRQTCDILKAIDAQTHVINDKFCQLEMREMQRENQNLRDQVQQFRDSALSQQQAQNIINQVRPCPIPAYITCNPYGCNGYSGYPYSNGCNCNNNNGNF